MLAEVEVLADELTAEGRHSVFAPLSRLRPFALNVLISLLIGDRLDPKDPLFHSILSNLHVAAQIFS